MKIVFAGTPDFAKQHLEMVLDSKHEIVGVLTQPDRRSGRGKKLQSSAVKELALRKGLLVMQPEVLKNDETVETLTDLNPDIILVVAYGLLVPTDILNIPKLGCINVHASLLPRWRGASPMEYAILNGDKEIGVSYMKMSEGLDEGPVYEMHATDLKENDDLKSAEEKLINLSRDNLNIFLDNLEEGKAKHFAQDHQKASLAPKIVKDLLQIDWAQETAETIVKKINALGSKYGTYTYLGDKRIKILKAKVNLSKLDKGPGYIEPSKENLVVQCDKNSSISIDVIQMQGKNRVSGQEFVSGYEDLIREHKFFNVAVR